MNRYYYDLHLHSCLSPCADDDMTPANIAGMASLKGLQLLALTDHNTCRNCPAFFDACKAFGIVPVPGMELTTAEDVHIVFLFPSLECAMAFDAQVYPRLAPVKNRPEIFGNQQIVDVDDCVIGTEEKLLINATTVDIPEALQLAEQFGAAVYPAHIDRPSNGMIAVLGCVPEEYAFSCFELNDPESKDSVLKTQPHLSGLRTLCSSDAHRLWDIQEAEHFIDLDDEPYSSALVRERLIEELKR